MKALFSAGAVLFAMIACTPQQQSPTGSLGGQWLGGGPGAAQVGGSAGNTTTAFDGTYQGISNRSASAASQLTAGIGRKTVDITTPGCQPFNEPPTLTVKNGLAQFQAMGVTFAGYVTPQGHLTMHSGYGATMTGQARPAQVDQDFDGDFDYQTHILQGKVSSVNCTYNLNWQRVT